MLQTEIVRSSSHDVMNDFLDRYVDHMDDFTHMPLGTTGLGKELESYPLRLTHFNDIYDTLLYSKTIAEALKRDSTIEEVIDFGAGSSISTLLAIKETSHKAHVTAVDIDPEALEISRFNAELLGLINQYNFHLGPMENFLETKYLGLQKTLIVSNPPYIATPPEMSGYHLLPINGGEDGCRYIMDFLRKDYPRNTTLALFWGSLCNPSIVVPAILERYEVIHAHAVKIHFGHYTSLPEVKDHLYKLKEDGRVSFDCTDQGEVQIVIGTILRPR